MISDLSESKNRGILEYDLCIVGSGPAGITVANELKGSGLKICVLESGKMKPTRLGDRLRKVQSEGIQIKEYSRERVLGGASTTWSGLSSPLDSIDMRPRSYLHGSGWPVSLDELMPFYQAAAERYRFPPLALFRQGELAPLKEKGDFHPAWRRVEEKIFMAAAEPQNFGKEFSHIFDDPNVDCRLDATLVRLDGDAQHGRIVSGAVRTSKGTLVKLKAKVFVLAAGGIENARILLNSRDLCPDGLGNEHDRVGRYMMNHPKNYYGVIRLNRPVKELPYYFGCLYQGYAGYAGMRLLESVQEEKGCLNSYARFEPLFPWSDNDGVEAFVLIAKRLKFLFRSWKRFKKGKIVSLRDYSETGDDTELQNKRKSRWEWALLFLKIFPNLPQVLRYLYYRLREKADPKIKAVRLRNFMEMGPDPENRVLLGEERDVYGQPLPVVRHQVKELDRQSLIALHEVLQEEISRSGLGELVTKLNEEKEWPIDQDASHHMGTTRMGGDPRTSVVNADCRLHGVENVYMAGGSVFPTSGCANPTFTIVALAIRLAKHLRENVFGLKQGNE